MEYFLDELAALFRKCDRGAMAVLFGPDSATLIERFVASRAKLKPPPFDGSKRIKHVPICELCYRERDPSETDWELIFQSWVCGYCQRIGKQEFGGLANCRGGCYSGGKQDPRAVPTARYPLRRKEADSYIDRSQLPPHERLADQMDPDGLRKAHLRRLAEEARPQPEPDELDRLLSPQLTAANERQARTIELLKRHEHALTAELADAIQKIAGLEAELAEAERAVDRAERKRQSIGPGEGNAT